MLTPFRLVLLFCAAMLLVASCATPAASPTAPPAAAPTAVAQAPTAAPTAAAPAATAIPTINPNLPTPPPRITAGPTAAPFALEAGWWERGVCYQVFVRSFYDSNGDGIGDLNGLTQKLDYVNDGDPTKQQDLGATCIWLMPISEAHSYHGYDVTDYYSVEQDYGTNDDFKHLVSEAERRGIKIIIDLVLNHTSREHPWFQEALNDPNSLYRDWYLWSKEKPTYKGPWAQEVWHTSPVGDEYYYGVFWDGMPDLNYRNPAVTAEAHKISAFWLNEMGAAGFRLDAIKHLIENGAAQEDTVETHNWLREYRTFLAQTKPGNFTIGEIFNGTPFNLAAYYPDQNDMYFEFDVAKQTRGAADIGLANNYLKAVNEAYSKLPFARWSPFLSNHDQNRVMSELDNDMGKAKVAATAMLTLPGLPFVYYGEEIGMLGLKPDERLRTPMQWNGDENGGFSTGKPWQAFQDDYRTKHVAGQDADADSLLNHYRRLIHLHTAEPALHSGDFQALTSSDSSVAAFIRQTGESAVLVLINFDKTAVENVSLTVERSALAEGNYQLTPLLGEGAAAALTVGANGAISDYVPLPALPAQTGFIFRLTR